MSLEQRWRRYAEGPLTPAGALLWLMLAPLGFLYGGITRLRCLLYRRGLLPSYRAPVPVISVGNLTVGGTGKTPVVDRIVRYSLSRGERPAVVSRGYGGRIRSGVALVSCGNGAPPRLMADVCGDEPYLIARRNPQAIVVVAPKRRDGVMRAIEECGATLIILDDGYQHLAVSRDLDILLLDATRPFGNGHVLPAGLLREPAAALDRAHLCIFTRSRGTASALSHPIPTLWSRHGLRPELYDLEGQSCTVAALAGRRGVAFAGIARPETFFAALLALGLDLVATVALNDHCVYDAETLATLNTAAKDADFFVTTEKDGVKLRACLFERPCFQALLELELHPATGLEAAIDRILPDMRRS